VWWPLTVCAWRDQTRLNSIRWFQTRLNEVGMEALAFSCNGSLECITLTTLLRMWRDINKILQCAKDCGPRKRTRTRMHTQVFTPALCASPSYFFNVCALFLSTFIHVKNRINQWNMQKMYCIDLFDYEGHKPDTQGSINAFRIFINIVIFIIQVT